MNQLGKTFSTDEVSPPRIQRNCATKYIARSTMDIQRSWSIATNARTSSRRILIRSGKCVEKTVSQRRFHSRNCQQLHLSSIQHLKQYLEQPNQYHHRLRIYLKTDSNKQRSDHKHLPKRGSTNTQFYLLQIPIINLLPT